jgi:hypothetical protein
LYVSLLVTHALFVSAQRFQQRFGFLQVFRVKPFGEPAIDLRQQLAGLSFGPTATY